MISSSYIGSAAFLGRVRDDKRPPAAKADPWLQDFREGFSAVWRNPVMRPIGLLDASSGFFATSFVALFPFIARRKLNLGALLFATMFAPGGVGTLGGAALRPWMTGRFGIAAAALIIAVGLIASTGFDLFSPLRSVRDLPEPPQD